MQVNLTSQVNVAQSSAPSRVALNPVAATKVAIPTNVPSRTQNFLQNIAASTAIPENAKTALAQIAASVDQNLTPAAQANVYSQLSTLGIYLEGVNPNTYPRWMVLTALRIYGAGLQSAPQQVTAERAESHVQAQIQNIAREVTGKSIEQIQQKVFNDKSPTEVKQQISQYLGDSVAPKADAKPAVADAPKVDTLV